MDFPLAKFRILYPQFETVTDEVVEVIAEQALCYIGLGDCTCNDQLWMLMAAHLLQLRFNSEDGAVAPGAVTSASIDRVSIGFSAPTSSNSWGHWLNLTPFGQQFLALYNRCNTGGRYAGAYPERAGFRNVGGVFPLNGRSGRWP